MTGDGESRISLHDLQIAFEREVTADKRAAAETAYALAFRYRNQDVDGRRRFDLAKQWARRAIKLLDELPSDRLDQIATTRASVGGVDLPGLLHAGVVRERLADVLF
ncbi:hypothetical protein [Amycolatopsis sp. GM8]|uniref:hypothetical protein n=1 Tax=Amycolatopsis sp. GM8 TaxID=2896530 RepID=UPI001F179CCA|nr:hypothetical protein [Amycolatopsis sp. GM8]